MAREPQRAAQPRHLDAHLVPVEKALIARAKAIEEANEILDKGDTAHAVALLMANEFRLLADEMHFW